MLLQEDSYKVILPVVVTAILFLMLIVFSIAFLLIYQKRRQEYIIEKQALQNQFTEALLQSQLETHESTLHQISEELHDNIGQLLSSTKMLLGITGMNMDNTPDTLKTAEATLGKAIQDLRALSKSLNKEWLHQFNIVDNLKMEVDRINASRTIGAVLYYFHCLPAHAGRGAGNAVSHCAGGIAKQHQTCRCAKHFHKNSIYQRVHYRYGRRRWHWHSSK